MSLGPADAAAFERCIAGGGVALFPADTVYGLACDPSSAEAVRRLYALKGRPPDKPSAVMFFARDRALDALPELGPRTRAALVALLPGGVTLLLPNPEHRFAAACGPDPDTIGLRVPAPVAGLSALGAVSVPIAQSSANVSGGPEARTVDAVAREVRDAADLVLDGGPLPGVASTVVDLRDYERGEWRVLRAGAVESDSLRRVLVDGREAKRS